MILFAKLLSHTNSTLFSFFSGVFVSFSLNMFTGIILTPSIAFSPIITIALLLVLFGSGALMFESVLQQKFVEEVNKAKTVGLSVSCLLKADSVKKTVKTLGFVLFIAIITVVGGIILTCIYFI